MPRYAQIMGLGYIPIIVGVLIASLNFAVAADLRYGIKSLPQNLGNPYVAEGPVADSVRAAIFDGLTRLDSNGAVAPALALSWENISETSWRLKLRRDVEFSNGEPFNAETVARIISWLQSPDGVLTLAARHVERISQIEVENSHTVVLHTTRPDAILPNRLAAVAMVAPDAWERLGSVAFALTPAGTGPFTVSSWAADSQQIELHANEQSWRVPKVDALTLISLPNTDARAQAVLDGDVHVANGLELANIKPLQDRGIFVTAVPALSVAAIAYRLNEGRATPLIDKRVRQALNLAVNTSHLSAEILDGLAAPSGQPAGRWTMGYNPDVRPYPFDPERAKALMFDAGIVSEFGLRFDVVTGRAPGDSAMLERVAEDLRIIGVNAEMRVIPYGRWLESYASGLWPNDTDGFLLPFDAMPTNDVQSALMPYTCENPAPFYCDSEVSAEILSASETVDYSARLNVLDALTSKIHDEAPALFLTEQFDLFALSRLVEGFSVAGRVPVYENISLRD